jgi:hypothetical protein
VLETYEIMKANGVVLKEELKEMQLGTNETFRDEMVMNLVNIK